MTSIFQTLEEDDSERNVFNENAVEDSFIIFLNAYNYILKPSEDYLNNEIGNELDDIFLSRMSKYVNKNSIQLISSLVATKYEKEMFFAVITHLLTKDIPVAIKVNDGWKWLVSNNISSLDRPVFIYPQFKYENYTADFLLKFNDKELWIECDGRTVHSTKKRFIADRQKDRQLQKTFTMMRFSNSEIVSSTHEIVIEIAQALFSQGYNWSHV